VISKNEGMGLRYVTSLAASQVIIQHLKPWEDGSWASNVSLTANPAKLQTIALNFEDVCYCDEDVANPWPMFDWDAVDAALVDRRRFPALKSLLVTSLGEPKTDAAHYAADVDSLKATIEKLLPNVAGDKMLQFVESHLVTYYLVGILPCMSSRRGE
jgi:hypothetical protein